MSIPTALATFARRLRTAGGCPRCRAAARFFLVGCGSSHPRNQWEGSQPRVPEVGGRASPAAACRLSESLRSRGALGRPEMAAAMATAGSLRSESAGSRGLVPAPGLPLSFRPSVFPPSFSSLLRQRGCGSGASR